MAAPISDGKSIATAVPITALDSSSGIEQENRYLSARFGREGVDWFFRLSELIPYAGRWYECVIVETARRRLDVYFDITLLMEAQDAALRGLGCSPSRKPGTSKPSKTLSSFSQLMWQAQHCWARIAHGK